MSDITSPEAIRRLAVSAANGKTLLERQLAASLLIRITDILRSKESKP